MKNNGISVSGTGSTIHSQKSFTKNKHKLSDLVFTDNCKNNCIQQCNIVSISLDCCFNTNFKMLLFKCSTYSYSHKYFAFLKYINFKEKMLREGIILKYFSYILINITRGTQKYKILLHKNLKNIFKVLVFALFVNYKVILKVTKVFCFLF